MEATACMLCYYSDQAESWYFTVIWLGVSVRLSVMIWKVVTGHGCFLCATSNMHLKGVGSLVIKTSIAFVLSKKKMEIEVQCLL